MTLANEFKAFLLRGNIADLAIAFVMGAAFTTVVSSMVEDFFMPFVAAIFGEPDFSGLTFTINGSLFRYGEVVNAVVSLVLVGAVLFFFVVKPINAFVMRAHRRAPADPTLRQCPECLSVIPRDACRCAYCTALLEAA